MICCSSNVETVLKVTSGRFEKWCARSNTHSNLRSGTVKMESDGTEGYRVMVLQGWRATVLQKEMFFLQQLVEDLAI